MENFNEESQAQEQNHKIETAEPIGPDYIAMQYRQVRIGDGWKTKKERIGAAFNNENGSICFRPTGQQVIENDIYLFPTDQTLG
jgi:hypothetical protein